MKHIVSIAVVLALAVLGGARRASAQIGYEIEWNVPTMIIEEGPNGGMDQPAQARTAGYRIGVKKLLGKYRNWHISIDNISHSARGTQPCDPAVRALFPNPGPAVPVPGGGGAYAAPAPGQTQGLFSYDKVDMNTLRLGGVVPPANRRRNWCGQGIIEFQTAVPRTTQADIAQDFADLRAYIEAWETAPALATVARAGGAPALPGVGNASTITNGCNNTFGATGCVLRFPVHPTRTDAINQTNPEPDTYWYVVIPQAGLGGGAHPFASQINVDIPLSYFANPPPGPAMPGHNAFLWAQFGAANNLWPTTATWNFGRTLNDTRKGFYRVLGYYAHALDARIAAAPPGNVTGGFQVSHHGVPHLTRVFPKNTVNPNPKFDPCAVRRSFLNVGKYLRRFYAGPGATIFQIQNRVGRDVIDNDPPASCSFVTGDVNRIPMRNNRPVFEFRFANTQPCWQLVRWLRAVGPPAATGPGGLTTLSTACAADLP